MYLLSGQYPGSSNREWTPWQHQYNCLGHPVEYVVVEYPHFILYFSRISTCCAPVKLVYLVRQIMNYGKKYSS